MACMEPVLNVTLLAESSTVTCGTTEIQKSQKDSWLWLKHQSMGHVDLEVPSEAHIVALSSSTTKEQILLMLPIAPGNMKMQRGAIFHR